MHPSIPLFVTALLMILPLRRLRQALLITGPLFAAAAVFAVFSSSPGPGTLPVTKSMILLGKEWIFFHADKLSLLFVYTFLFFGFASNTFALHTKNRPTAIASQVYLASAIGAVLSGDLVVLFIFWEVMAISSAVLIWNKKRPASLYPLYRYLLIHGAGGLIFFAGIIVMLVSGSSLGLHALSLDGAGILIFTAFCINAAVVPLHAWLPDSYPAGSPAASVYLSAFTTKVAVYAFARFFPGLEILIYLGAVTAVYGVVYALMENDIRKLLSYHIVCQVGYMILGIGLASPLGLAAGTGHAVGNILFKGLLFMATGAVLHATQKSKLTDLGGFAKKRPWVFVFYMVGALAISGFPFLNGYVTKSLLVAASLKAHHGWLELLLLMVAVGTFLSIACKLAYFAFLHRPAPQTRLVPIPANMYFAMAMTAAACFFTGVFPERLLYPVFPSVIHYEVYTADHILQTLLLLLGGFAGFLLMLRYLHTKAAIALDTDWFYRKGSALFVKGFCVPLRQGQEAVQGAWTGTIALSTRFLTRFLLPQTFNAVGYPVLWMLAGFIILASLFCFR